MSNHVETDYDEIYRPQFHFTSRTNWLNDPNGLVFDQGEYHLFFQHNPFGLQSGNLTWGHAISKDLVHWDQLPDAIEPDHLGPIWSGSAVVDRENTTGFQTGPNDTLVAIYTAAGGTSPESKGQPFTQCIAYSTDRGRRWTKYSHNPVLPHVVGEDRDPKVVWYEPDRRWIMALYLDADRYALFSSPDLKQWTMLEDFSMEGCGECPDFFEIPVEGETGQSRWVFTAANGKYLVGQFDGKRFVREGGIGQVEYGANCYAVQTYSGIPEHDGRRIQIGWMAGGSYPGMPFNQQMSFPCVLTLHRLKDGLHLFKQPAREIERLHEKPHRWRDLTLQPGENPLSTVSGDLFDIRVELEMADAAEFGVKARGASVSCNVKEQMLSSAGRTAPLEMENGRIQLQILVDRTSFEVYGNHGRAALSSCFLPVKGEPDLEIYAVGGPVQIKSLEVFPLHRAWPGTSGRM